MRRALWAASLGVGILLGLLAVRAWGGEPQNCSWAEPEFEHCCLEHSQDYRIGGTELDRERADWALGVCLEFAGADQELIEAVVRAVRRFGGAGCLGPRCWRYSGG